MAPKVFVVGPGYTGREIIDLLLAEGKYEISALFRRKEAAKEFERDGVKAHLGTLDDHDLIKRVTVQSDIVFHTATADHLASAQAILDGIEERAAEGKETIYLHQSGASVLSDGLATTLNSQVFSDLKPERIDALSDEQPHRAIDLALIKTRKTLGHKAKIFIVMPPLIYGVNKKHNRLSIQIPALTRYALKHGNAGYVSTGEAAWNGVHVLDLAQAYVLILHWLEGSPASADWENPYFFCESSEFTWGELAKYIGESLQKVGKLQSAETKTIPEGQWGDLFGEATPHVFGNNTRNSADRLRKLGWKATHADIQTAIIDEDLPIILKDY